MNCRRAIAGAAMIVIAIALSASGAPVQSGPGLAPDNSALPFADIDSKALFSPDRTAREREIQRFLSAPDRYIPVTYLGIAEALLQSGRADEARTWFYRGRIRLLVDIEFSRVEFGAVGLGDLLTIYDTGGAVGVPQNLGTFVQPENDDALTRVTDNALTWDAATPRSYPLNWMLGHSMEAYAGANINGSLKPGWEHRLAAARDTIRVAFIRAREQKAEEGRAEEARATAANAGIAAQEAAEPSNDPLDSNFAKVARPIRTIDLHGCAALSGQPMDDQGKTLLVRCPDFEKVDLTTGAVLRRLPLSSIPTDSDCKIDKLGIWPPSYMEMTPPSLDFNFAASARSDSIFMVCQGIWNYPLSGGLASLRLPIIASIDGAPLAALELNARETHIDASRTTIRLMTVSADGRYLLLTADSGESTFGLLIDIATRRARALRPADLPMKGMAQPYSGFSNAVLIAEPLAVVANVNRPVPGGRRRDRANTVVVWPLDGSPPKGIDMDEWTEPSEAGPPANLILDRGPISLMVALCGGGRCDASQEIATTNTAAGFKNVHFDLVSGAVHWFDPRDMWIGSEAEARSRYGAGSGPLHCEAVPSGSVVLGHRWATEPFAARLFPHSGPVWCAMSDQAKRLIVGVGRYAHVYELQ